MNDCFNCTHPRNNIKLLQVVPFEINEDITNILSYFMFRAPGISSAHAVEVVYNPDKIFKEFISKASFKRVKIMVRYSQKQYQQLDLDDDELCVRCPRMIMSRYDKVNYAESELDCLLRHLRNSIAHGYVFYLLRNNRHYLMFEDRQKNNNLSARIVVNREILVKLKKIILQDIKHNKLNKDI